MAVTVDLRQPANWDNGTPGALATLEKYGSAPEGTTGALDIVAKGALALSVPAKDIAAAVTLTGQATVGIPAALLVRAGGFVGITDPASSAYQLHVGARQVVEAIKYLVAAVATTVAFPAALAYPHIVVPFIHTNLGIAAAGKKTEGLRGQLEHHAKTAQEHAKLGWQATRTFVQKNPLIGAGVAVVFVAVAGSLLSRQSSVISQTTNLGTLPAQTALRLTPSMIGNTPPPSTNTVVQTQHKQPETEVKAAVLPQPPSRVPTFMDLFGPLQDQCLLQPTLQEQGSAPEHHDVEEQSTTDSETSEKQIGTNHQDVDDNGSQENLTQTPQSNSTTVYEPGEPSSPIPTSSASLQPSKPAEVSGEAGEPPVTPEQRQSSNNNEAVAGSSQKTVNSKGGATEESSSLYDAVFSLPSAVVGVSLVVAGILGKVLFTSKTPAPDKQNMSRGRLPGGKNK